MAGHRIDPPCNPGRDKIESEAHQKNPFGITGMVMEMPDRYRLTPDHVLKVDLSRVGGKSPVAGAKNILKEIAQRVNN